MTIRRLHRFGRFKCNSIPFDICKANPAFVYLGLRNLRNLRTVIAMMLMHQRYTIALDTPASPLLLSGLCYFLAS